MHWKQSSAGGSMSLPIIGSRSLHREYGGKRDDRLPKILQPQVFVFAVLVVVEVDYRDRDDGEGESFRKRRHRHRAAYRADPDGWFVPCALHEVRDFDGDGMVHFRPVRLGSGKRRTA